MLVDVATVTQCDMWYLEWHAARRVWECWSSVHLRVQLVTCVLSRVREFVFYAAVKVCEGTSL